MHIESLKLKALSAVLFAVFATAPMTSSAIKFKKPKLKWKVPNPVKVVEKAAQTVVQTTTTVAEQAGKTAAQTASTAAQTANTVVQGAATVAVNTTTGVVTTTGEAVGTVTTAVVTGAGTVAKSTIKGVGEISGNVLDEAGMGFANLERETKRGATNAQTNLRVALRNNERALRKAGSDVGQGLKTVQGEVEDASVAVYRYTVRQVESSAYMLSDAEQRFREGKVLDAMWHLAYDPMQNTSENAALAASESAALSMAGSIAASVYGGPSGAAAYAAWLAYYRTGGDVDAALRVGIKTAALSYATQYAQEVAGAAAAGAGTGAATSTSSQAAAGATVQAAAVKESLKRAAIGGALSGIAVAASGGSAADVRNAMLATAGSMLVQDGYGALEASQTVGAFAQAAKQVYCVKTLVENQNDKSCPSLTDYLKDGNGRYAMLDTDGNVQYVDLQKEIPGSEWVFLSPKEALNKAAGMAGSSLDLDKLPIKEFEADVKAKIQAANKIKDANIVSLSQDRWALSYTPVKPVDALNAVVPPAVVLNYVGLSPAKLAESTDAARQAVEAALPTQPQEIVSCVRNGAIERYWISRGTPEDSLKCAVSVDVKNEVSVIWYAKNDLNSCQRKLVEIAQKSVANNYTCHGR